MLLHRHLKRTVAVVAALLAIASTPARAGSLGLHDYGVAPEIIGIEKWLNSEPLTIGGLRGKVVLPVATGGTPAHVLVVDYALRPVLAFTELTFSNSMIEA